MRISIFLILLTFLSNLLFLDTSKALAVDDPKLPPCAQWLDPNGNNITTDNAMQRVKAANQEFASEETKQKANIKCSTVSTAIGDIDTDPRGFVKTIYSTVLGLAGGIALLLVVVAGYRIMMSQGNPEALKEATGQLMSAVTGLLFIIFSFLLLEIIGVDILQIPGFGR